MAKVARRMERIDSSGIRKVFDLAGKLVDPINLSIGQPDFAVPEEAKREAVRAIEEDFNGYTPTQGIPELIEAVRGLMVETRGWGPEGVLITSGVSGGIMLALNALVDPGDEVVFGDPYFVMYRHITSLLDGVPVGVDTYPDFRLTAERIEKALTAKSKVLLLNSPCNPTGVVSTARELGEIAELAKSRGLVVISDEIYDGFCYDGEFASIVKDLPNTILLGGFSKSYAMTGWRLGYACGDGEIIGEMTKLQQFTFVCAPSAVQWAGLAALKTDPRRHLGDYRKRRDVIYEGLKGRFELVRPEGAFYAFPRVPWGTDEEFVRRCLEARCLVIPGSVFSKRGTHFRISYATSFEELGRGIEVLNRLAG